MTSKEALETVKDYLLQKLKEDNSELGSIIIVESVNVLEKLVDKDTPLKPNDNIMKDYYHCSKCGREIPECVNKHFMRYCPNCGQRLDWSK